MNRRVVARRIAHNVGWNFAAQAWLLVLALATTPFVVDRLGVEAFGLYAIVLALIGWFAVLDLGLGMAAVKYVSEEHGRGDLDAMRRVIGTALTLYLVVGVLGAATLALAAPFVAKGLLDLDVSADLGVAVLRLTALGFVATTALAALTAVPVALQRLDLVNVRMIFIGSASLLGTVGVLAVGYGLREVVGAMIVATAVGAVSFARLSRRLLPTVTLRPRFDHATAHRLLSFGAVKFVGHLSTHAVYHLDKLIVGALMGVAAVAFYAVPVLVAHRLVSLVTNVATAFFPAASDLHGRADSVRFRELYVRATKLVALVVFPAAVLLTLFAEPLLRLWVGDEFAREGTWPLRLLVAGYALNALTTIPALAADSVGRPRVPAAFAVASGVVNIGLSFALIPPFGLVGASCAILGTSVVFLPPFLLYVHRFVLRLGVGVVLRRSLLRPALATALAALPAAALVPLADSLLSLAACMAAGGIAYVLLTVVVGVYDATDRDVIRASLTRIAPEAS